MVGKKTRENKQPLIEGIAETLTSMMVKEETMSGGIVKIDQMKNKQKGEKRIEKVKDREASKETVIKEQIVETEANTVLLEKIKED